MIRFFENLIARGWNRIVSGNDRPHWKGGLNFGTAVVDGYLSQTPVVIPHIKRTEHIATLGKTGTGKTSLLKHLVAQDIAEDRGFVFFDHHGDTTPHILACVAEQEQKRRIDLSPRLIVIEPGDPLYSVGLNVLEHQTGFGSLNAIEEFSQILKQRWHLETFGARTEELLRNALCVLADCHLTVLELAPLLSNAAFRSACVRQCTNEEVRGYFEDRYDRVSEAMQAVYRDAILNKATAFTADPHFRHILGQSESSFSLAQAIDNGCWVILNLDKGRLGEQAATLRSLFLTKLKNALFSRQRRNSLFTLYCDEIQNLVTYGSGLDAFIGSSKIWRFGGFRKPVF
jgi:energy-coupling factor transporter ATP-binding protein EcfA2